MWYEAMSLKRETIKAIINNAMADQDDKNTEETE